MRATLRNPFVDVIVARRDNLAEVNRWLANRDLPWQCFLSYPNDGSGESSMLMFTHADTGSSRFWSIGDLHLVYSYSVGLLWLSHEKFHDEYQVVEP